MKKTVIINIGNSILHISEDAYDVLTKYLHEIKLHFAKNIDDFEIVKDIEYRIAEMLNESLAEKGAQLIEMNDVELVISKMGHVKDFEFTEVEESKNEQTFNTSIKKELFRDEDNRIIAGVCAGLSHYLRIPTIWIRIAFILLTMSFFFGVLVYVILWMAVPRAKSRSEKMRMRGEGLDLNAFQKSFEEEVNLLKQKMRETEREYKPLIEKSIPFFEEVGLFVKGFFSALFKWFGKLFGALVITFGSLLLLSLITGLAVLLGFWDADVYSYFPLNIINEEFRIPIILSVFVWLLIPILALLLFAIRVLFNLRPLPNRIALGLLVAWLVALFSGVFYGAKLGSEFKEEASLEQTVSLTTQNMYTLTLNNEADLRAIDSLNYNLNSDSLGNKRVVYKWYNMPNNMDRNVRMVIKRSESSSAFILQNFESHGKTFKEALDHAKKIDYRFTQNGDLLKFNYFAYLLPGQLYRDQKVRLTLNFPEGTILKIHDDFIHFTYFNHRDCENQPKREGSFTFWKITESGLACIKSDHKN